MFSGIVGAMSQQSENAATQEVLGKLDVEFFCKNSTKKRIFVKKFTHTQSNIIVVMNYPSVSEYIDALSCASDTFATLTSLTLVLDSNGKPVYTKETHSIVFRMRDSSTGGEYDVRCFTDDQEGRETKYEQIVRGSDVWYPKGISYIVDELFVDTADSDINEFPVAVFSHCNTTNIISFIRANVDDSIILSKLVYDFSRLVVWVYENGYSWHNLNADYLFVDETGHIIVSDFDELVVIADDSTDGGHLNAILILLSLKAISREKGLFDLTTINPQILFDGNEKDSLSSNKIINKLLTQGDKEIISLIGAIFVFIGQGDLCDIQSKIFCVTPPPESEMDNLIIIAEKGDVSKQLELAQKYLECKNYDESFKWYERASAQDNAEAICGLGICYQNGYGTEKDETRAFQLFLKASEMGLLEAQFQLAEAYHFGKGILRDDKKAMDLYYKTAQKGHCISEFMIGEHLMHTHTTLDIANSFVTTSKRDTIKAFDWFIKSAKQGYHPAQRRIGAFYETGTDPCVRNVGKAIEWYQKAAEQENSKAIFALGRLYANGIDEKNPDNNRAFEYYLQAANMNLPEAQYRVGIALLFGKGTVKDMDSAISWIRKSSEQGYAAAITLLSELEKKTENTCETDATGLELASAEMDAYGVLYSQDGKKLLKYSLEEGYGNEYLVGSIYHDVEESEFGEIKQQSLNSYKVKAGTEIICDSAFSECESLQSIFFPPSIRHIGGDAFYSCENLEFVGVCEGIEHIGTRAFAGCVNLESLTLPQSLKTIATDSLTGVQNIVSNSQDYVCSNNCLFTKDKKVLFYFFHNGEDTLDIPNGVEKIGDDAFSESVIRDVVIPMSVTEIGQNSFADCSNLEKIYLPQSVEKIGSAAFARCEKLYGVYLPEQLRIIESQAFTNCDNLSFINLPDSVKEIGSGAFMCTNIKSVVLPRDLEELGCDVFAYSPIQELKSSSERFVVKDMAIYTDNEKTFVNYYGGEPRFKIPEGVEVIADFAFGFTCPSQEIVFPRSIKHIRHCFFQYTPQRILVPSEIKDLVLEALASFKHKNVIEYDSD